MTKIDATTRAKVAHAGELLIRAAAVLGTLSEEQQQALRIATAGELPGSVVQALNAAKLVSPAVAKSLLTHPPRGLVHDEPQKVA